MNARKNQGFTTVELVITIIVGVMFLITTSQIYTVVIADSANTRNKANASAIAYSTARIVLATIGTTCNSGNLTFGSGPTPAAPSLASLPAPTSITAVVNCPFASAVYSNNSAVSRLTVTITYGPNAQKARHVLYKY